MTTESGFTTVNPNTENPPLSSAPPPPVENEDDPAHERSIVRSIPPWVVTPDPNRGAFQPVIHPLAHPEEPVIPHHQYLPDSHKRAAKGRRFDHYRDAEPALLDQTLAESNVRWIPFMVSGPQYNPHDVEGARLMSDEWMAENMAWWNPGEEEEEAPQEKRRTWLLDSDRRRGSVADTKRTLLKNPFVPLILRIVVLTFALTALGLGGQIYIHTHSLATAEQGCKQRASTIMDLVVGSIAAPYIFYVTYDEYTAQPLGLRSATARISLLLLDLYFIVFYGSNVSLAFDALTDPRWACFSDSEGESCPKSKHICNLQSALAGVLVVALVAWVITFTVSVFRVVKKLRPDE